MNDQSVHICGECFTDEKGNRRDVCAFCAAMATSPDKRTRSMQTVIEGEKLQLEMLQLLKSNQDLVDSEARRKKNVEVWWCPESNKACGVSRVLMADVQHQYLKKAQEFVLQ